MKYRLDKYNNKLSILGLGCMRFPKQFGKTDMKATETLITEAIAGGINYFDTAYIYGDSEIVLGKILKAKELREKIYLATKLPFTFWRDKEQFEKCLNSQLKRLQTDYIDYYLIHMLTTAEQWQDLCDRGIKTWLKEKQNQSKIKQIGFSFHGSQADFLKILAAYDWDFCQIQYNYMNENYQAGKTGLKAAHQKGIPVVIMEPLLGGKLAVKLPKKVNEIFKKANPGLTPAAWALNWLWNQPEVTLLLSGMNSLEQLQENLATASQAEINMLNQKAVKTINQVVEIFNESYKIPCTGCNYCIPCPHGVNIPACFSSYNACYAIGRSQGIKQYFMSVGMTSSHNGRLQHCIKCGACEKKCPQHIEIINNLNLVQKKLEPFWLKWGFNIAEKMMKKNKSH